MTDRELNALPAELAAQLRFLDRKVRGLAVLRGAGLVCVVLCAGVAAGVLTDWLFDLGVSFRMAILAGVGGAALIAGATAIVQPLLRRTSSAELAALVDSSFPDLRERLESTVELADPDLPESQKGSELMRSLLLRETVRKAQNVDFGAAADGSSAFHWLLVGTLALIVLMAPFGLSRDGYGLMLTRFLIPWRNLERATNLYFEVADGDRTVARGEDVTIQAVPKWRISAGERPESVWLTWQNASGERDQRRMEWSDTDGSYVATLPHVFTSFEYDISAEGARTRRFHIDVVERPDITRLALEIVPPAYTGQAARTLDGAVGRTEVFERSMLTFAVDFNKPVQSADLVWLSTASGEPIDPSGVDVGDEDRMPLSLDPQETAGRLTFSPERSGAYAIVLRDEHDLQSPPGVARELVIVFDAPPQVVWSDLNPDQIVNIPPIEARPEDQVPLLVKASDDLGVSELELHLELIQRGEMLAPLTAESPQLGQPIVTHGFEVSLKNYELRQGDLLSVRARGVDGRPVPSPQEGWSPARLIRINKDADPTGLQALMAEQQKVRGAIAQIRQDIQEDREEARALETEAVQKQQERAPFERRTEISGLAESERDVQQRIDQLAAALGSHPLQRTLTEQTRQIAAEPVERARINFQEAGEAAPGEVGEQRDRLRKAIGDLSEADERLEQLLRKFEELAALERDLQQLQQLAEQAERLTNDVEQFEQDRKELQRLEKEQALNEQQQQQQQQQLAERQMDLQDEQQDLASALDHLLAERPEILDAARHHQRQQLEQLAQQAGALAEHQQRLADAMGREPEQARPETPAEGSEANPDEASSDPSDERDALAASRERPSQEQDAQRAGGKPGGRPPGEPNAAPGEAQQAAPQSQEMTEPEASPPISSLSPGDRPDAGQSSGPMEDPGAQRPQMQRPDGSPPERARTESPPPANQSSAETPPPGSDEEAPQTPAGRQREIAEDAARQALETARQQGLESEAARAARQFAEQALSAAEQAERGLLENAAQTARQAAESAQQTAEQMRRSAESSSARMTQQSEALAQQQADVAQHLQQTAQSPSRRQEAERQGQQRIATETSQLAEQLSQAAERLGSQPLDEQESGQRATEASQSAQQASQSQQQAQTRMQEQGLREAAEPASQAAESLRQASQRARDAGAQQQESESPVPGEVGQQIAEARRELEQAGRQLGPPQPGSPPGSEREQAQAGEPNPGEVPAESPQQQPGEQPGEGQQPGDVESQQAGEQGEQGQQPGEGQAPGEKGQPGQKGQPGEQQSASDQPGQDAQPSDQAGSEAMRRVTESLQQAASQMGLQRSQGSQNKGQNDQSGEAQEGADGPQGGYGARGALSLTELEAELGRISQRNWGQLPQHVESELQLSQQKKPDGDYARLIRMYFEDVARQQSAAEGLNVGGEEAE